MAYDPPEQYGRPISEWTAGKLADEMVHQGIVESISPRHMGRLLEEGSLKPHRSGYWLNPPDPTFDEKVEDICQTYLQVQERRTDGERTVSLDEMTGIQALERKVLDLPMRPGRIRQREFGYIRHDPQTLIASFDVASGGVIHVTVGEARTEHDDLTHVQQPFATDSAGTKWHLVMDCLTIHSSVRIVSALCSSSRGHRHRPGYQGQERHSPVNVVSENGIR